jgi:hypothetical protein
LPDQLASVAEMVRQHGPDASPLQLDVIKRRALMQASCAHPLKGNRMKSKLVTLLLAAGITVSGGAAGAIAIGGESGNKNAAKSQYVGGKDRCDAGRGNGSEGCDPGNSSTSPGGDKGQNQGGDEGGPIRGGTGVE